MPALPDLCRSFLNGLGEGRALGATDLELGAVRWRDVAVSPEPATPYGRAIVHASDLGEVMLASWREDTPSAIHDHGGAFGAVIVLEGHFVEERYRFDGDDVVTLDEQTHSAGSRVVLPSGTIHRMRTGVAGLTLHAYARSDGPMRLYDRDARVSWLVSGGGAWLPSRHVIGIERWGQPR